MAISSGSLGGDDSSKLDELIKSLSENTDKLEALGKILEKIQPSEGTGKSVDSEKDPLAAVEKVLSKKDVQNARTRAVEKQSEQDRLAQNTFRASETILSEVLSRVGGTSFYPALSALRVARESVSAATGTPQSELKVTDMVKFVNESTKDLIGNIFSSIGLSSPFGASKLSNKFVGPDGTISEIDEEVFNAAKTVAGIAGLAIPIGFLTENFKDLSQSIINFGAALTGTVISIASNPSGTNTLKAVTAPIQSATQVAGSTATLAGTIIGSLTPLGPIIGGPVGAFVGKALSDTLLLPVNFATDLLVSLNDSVTQIADDLVGFSPDVTGAVIGREIAILQDDFRRAAQIGPEIARITEAQTRLQLASRQAFDNILEVTEPYLVGILSALTLISRNSDFLLQVTEAIARSVPWGNVALTAIKGAMVGLAATVEDISDKLNTDNPLDLAALSNMQPNALFAENPGANVMLQGKP